ncbi:hypothetical protein [Amycolatopsis cihanbeyliensis]|uniref:Uncharacterized protein n=1 Tax=Amycolatopsis cihanbeyliensis TaxID=1128664 RepID=A0A542DNX0_AMYCI|nr:hypothetical protein [Amycolatopsis cihanbeyliensis]TQJ04674.1 hypothetical protein FB471_4479 [Amycolatopsis cihanbeyliensis]
MTTTIVDPFAAIRDRAIQLGREHGTAQAAWMVDQTASTEAARTALALYDDGDPVFYDMFSPRMPFSGEYADDYTTGELFEDCGYYPSGLHTDDTDAATFAEIELVEAYETEYVDACIAEVVRVLSAIADGE